MNVLYNDDSLDLILWVTLNVCLVLFYWLYRIKVFPVLVNTVFDIGLLGYVYSLVRQIVNYRRHLGALKKQQLEIMNDYDESVANNMDFDM